ncbi:YXWGXW repeat-containing protein [Paenibacillus oenotherae]|uniref:YXWGXW repeat-containing protein n=1 Tax=Paenibacillus oenotherae TaxID=1435645 RepID=A0ABS7D139_9BACL|nr:YXWGXW repeat-containing protein [Paenibacillus oenotherae]
MITRVVIIRRDAIGSIPCIGFQKGRQRRRRYTWCRKAYIWRSGYWAYSGSSELSQSVWRD